MILNGAGCRCGAMWTRAAAGPAFLIDLDICLSGRASSSPRSRGAASRRTMGCVTQDKRESSPKGRQELRPRNSAK
jgi:hypothetical protein